MEESSLYEVQLTWLRLVRDATSAGLVRWKMSAEDQDRYDAESEHIETYIQFRFPSYNDGDGSDRDYVRIGESRFMIGTPGWLLVLEILAAGLPEWRGHLETVRAGYERDILKLTEAMKPRRGA